MFGWRKKDSGWDDHKNLEFVELVSDLLQTQLAFAEQPLIRQRIVTSIGPGFRH